MKDLDIIKNEFKDVSERRIAIYYWHKISWIESLRDLLKKFILINIYVFIIFYLGGLLDLLDKQVLYKMLPYLLLLIILVSFFVRSIIRWLSNIVTYTSLNDGKSSNVFIRLMKVLGNERVAKALANK